MDAFLAHESLAGLELNTSQTTITSEYFAIYIESRFADRTIKLQTLVYRNASNAEIQLISRDRSSQYLWPKNEQDTKSG
jgi:type II secretory pathway component PulK